MSYDPLPPAPDSPCLCASHQGSTQVPHTGRDTVIHITLTNMIALLMAALFMGMYLRPKGDAVITHLLGRVLAVGVPTHMHTHYDMSYHGIHYGMLQLPADVCPCGMQDMGWKDSPYPPPPGLYQ